MDGGEGEWGGGVFGGKEIMILEYACVMYMDVYKGKGQRKRLEIRQNSRFFVFGETITTSIWKTDHV